MKLFIKNMVCARCILVIQHEQQAQTPMFIAVDKQVVGIISVADAIKADSAAAVQRMHKLGIKVVMLTGDNQVTAQAVAKQLGIDSNG